jgi:hypothetical protein
VRTYRRKRSFSGREEAFAVKLQRRLKCAVLPAKKAPVNYLLEELRLEGVDVEDVLQDYGLPNTRPEQEVRAFKRSILYHKGLDPTSTGKRAARILAQKCDEARTHIEDDWYSIENWIAAAKTIDISRSPGPLWTRIGCMKNDHVLKRFDPDDRENAFRKLALASKEWFETASCGIYGAFSKWELHTIEKLSDNRQRLIMGAHLYQQIAEALIFIISGFSAKLRDAAPNIPVATGYITANNVFNTVFQNVPVRKGHKILGLDVSSADVCITQDSVENNLVFIQNMTYGDQDTLDAFYATVRRCYWLAFKKCVFIFSDGTMYLQLMWGYLKSGAKFTLDFNSIDTCIKSMQVRLNIGHTEEEVFKAWLIGLGDDSMDQLPEKDIDAFVDEKRKLGCTVKESEKQVTDTVVGQEFCGFTVMKTRYHKREVFGLIPTRYEKQLLNLCYTKECSIPNALNSFRINWYHDKEAYTAADRIFVRLIQAGKASTTDYTFKERIGWVLYGDQA